MTKQEQVTYDLAYRVGSLKWCISELLRIVNERNDLSTRDDITVKHARRVLEARTRVDVAPNE